MKRQIICLLLMLTWAVPALGATYEGLTPGRSTRAEADKALGAPLQVLSGGRTLIYNSAGHDLKALSVRLRDDKQTIAIIKLTFLKPYAVAMVRQLFFLRKPDKTETDLLDRRTETYAGKGIKLHFTGASLDESVAGLSHIEIPDIVEGYLTATKTAPAHVPSYLGLIMPKIATYGLCLINTCVDSPAAAAGLKMGDEILTVDGRDVSGGRLNPVDFVELIASKNAQVPLVLRIRRDKRIFNINITLAALDRQFLEQCRQADYQLAQVVYKQATELKNKKEYATAAPPVCPGSRTRSHRPKQLYLLGLVPPSSRAPRCGRDFA